VLSLIEAARVSGQSKATIWRAVNSGRLSAKRTYTGDYQIDPAELHRIFSLGTGEGRATTVSVKRDAMAMERAETDLMQAQIDRLFQVGELIRNELTRVGTPGAVRLTFADNTMSLRDGRGSSRLTPAGPIPPELSLFFERTATASRKSPPDAD
jgi:hypothetical protein